MMEDQLIQNTQADESTTIQTPQFNPYSLFLIFILLYYSFNSNSNPESQEIQGGGRMKAFSISDEDIQLVNAVKPFMSPKSQELIDVALAVINVFRPQDPDQTFNIEALKQLLSMVHESFEAQKAGKVYEAKNEVPESSKDVKNLLNVIAEKQINQKDI